MSANQQIVPINFDEVVQELQLSQESFQQEQVKIFAEHQRRRMLQVWQSGYERACKDYKVGKFAQS